MAAWLELGGRCAWELVKNYADERPLPWSFPGVVETDVSGPTQPESLILAQSERWRQA